MVKARKNLLWFNKIPFEIFCASSNCMMLKRICLRKKERKKAPFKRN